MNPMHDFSEKCTFVCRINEKYNIHMLMRRRTPTFFERLFREEPEWEFVEYHMSEVGKIGCITLTKEEYETSDRSLLINRLIEYENRNISKEILNLVSTLSDTSRWSIINVYDGHLVKDFKTLFEYNIKCLRGHYFIASPEGLGHHDKEYLIKATLEEIERRKANAIDEAKAKVYRDLKTFYS